MDSRPGARAHNTTTPQRAGVLQRRSGFATGWQSSWCVLGPGRQLGVFDGKGGVRQALVDLAAEGCVCRRSEAPGARATELELLTSERTHRLGAETDELCELWLAALREAIAGGSAAAAPVVGGASAGAAAAPVVGGVGASLEDEDDEALMARARQLVRDAAHHMPAPEPAPALAANVYVVVVDAVALRAKPSVRGSAVVGTALRGERLQVVAVRDGWAYVEGDTPRWAAVANGRQSCLVRAGEELRAHLEQHPGATRPRQATVLAAETHLFQGWMLKKGAVRQSWKCRWFVLENSHKGPKLRYYEEGSEHSTPHRLCGTIDLRACHAVRPADGAGLELEVEAETVHQQAGGRKRAAAVGALEQQQERQLKLRTFELFPVAEFVESLPVGMPKLGDAEDRTDLMGNWLDAIDSCVR